MLPDLGNDEWVRVGMAAKDGGVPFDKWNAWSTGTGADNYTPTVARTKWQNFQDGKGVGVGMLCKVAAEHWW